MKLYQHIKFIDNGNDFIVMAPIVRSNGISIDNTCGAKNAFQSFLGTSNKGNQGGTDIYNSLRNIIKDNEEESKKRHEEGLPQRHIYLKAVEYLKFIESMKVKLDKFSSDNCEFKKIDKSNLHTLRLGVSVASQELSFPRQTISFRGFDLTSRIGKSQIFNISGESESKSNVLDMLQKHFSDPLISQENSPVSNNDESEVTHISALITEFESFYQMQHPKKIKLTAPTLENLDGISKLATEAEVLKKPLWKISKEPCITYKNDLSTGGLYKSVSDKDVFVVNREAVKVLCSYLKDVLLVDLNTADKFEIITYIINIFRFNIQELKPTNDLFMKIFNSNEEKLEKQKDISNLIQFILGMISIYIKDSKDTNDIKLENYISCLRNDNSLSNIIDYYVPTYKNSCIIESICHWFNQDESIPYQLDIEEIQSLKHDITRKWEAITGGIYNYGASPGATKMPHFDEFMLLSQTKSGYYEEFQYNICCNFIYLAEKEFGVKCSNNLLLKSPRKEPNKRLNQSLLATCCSLGLLVCYLLSPSNATKIMTAGILGKLPLINSLPILQIVIISVLLHTSINIFIETVNIENKTSKKSALKYTFIFIVSLAIITLISFILPSFSIIISQLLPWQAINVSGVPLLQAGIISLVISLISFVVNNIGGNGLKIPPSGVNNNVIDLKSDELKHDTSSNLTANHILNNTNTSNTEIQSAQGLRFGN